MKDFSGKRVIGSTTLGERLARMRQEANVSLEQIEEELGIQKKYIEFLERGEYNRLPGEIYTKSFLKKYAEYMQVNPDMVLGLYQKESNIVTRVKKPRKSEEMPKSIITPKTIRNSVIMVIVVAILIYLGLQIKMIFVPPELILESPPDNLTTNQAEVIVAGQTEAEAIIVINGQTVLADPAGHFEKTVDLQEGVNTITIVVSKERSQERVVTRQILYKKEDGNNN